jgi:hypothetical protein
MNASNKDVLSQMVISYGESSRESTTANHLFQQRLLDESKRREEALLKSLGEMQENMIHMNSG